MHGLGLTDLESLEEETLVIPGLDVDAAMANSIALGKKRIRQRRIVKIISGLSVLIVVLGILSVSAFAINDSDNKGTTRLASDLKLEPSSSTQTLPETTIPNTVPPTTIIPTPELVVVRTFGNQSACTASSQPDENGVQIGSSSSAEKFNAKSGQQFSMSGGNASQSITMAIKESPKATNGAFVDLVSGYTTTGSYANITTTGFTYCESGLKMTIEPQVGSGTAATGSEYVLTTERW